MLIHILCKGSFASVDSLVSSKIGAPLKAFSILITLIRSLSSVDSLMSKKLGDVSESFPTFVAMMGFSPLKIASCLI